MKPTREARHTFNIVVRGKHALLGRRGKPKACALVLAAMEQEPSCVGAEFNKYVSYLEFARHRDRYRNTPQLVAAIKRFDETGVMPVGTYTLRPPAPQETLRAVAIRNAEGHQYSGRTHPHKATHRGSAPVPKLS